MAPSGSGHLENHRSKSALTPTGDCHRDPPRDPRSCWAARLSVSAKWDILACFGYAAGSGWPGMKLFVDENIPSRTVQELRSTFQRSIKHDVMNICLWR